MQQSTDQVVVGVAADQTYEVRISDLGDGAHRVEVVHATDVLVSGVGLNLVDALIDVIRYMLPPDHPEYGGNEAMGPPPEQS